MIFFATVKGVMSIPWQRFLSLFLLVLPCVAACSRYGVAAERPTQAPLFIVRTANGKQVTGSWRQLQSDGSVRLGKGDGTWEDISGANVLSIRRVDALLPPLPIEDHLILANGDRIPFRNLRLVEEKFRFRHPDLENGKDVSLPLSAVSVLWYAAPDKELDAEKLRRRLTAATRTRDTVCLRNGDIIAGVLVSLDADNAVVEVDKRRVTVKAPQLAYIAFNTELTDALRPKGPYARLVLRDKQPGCGGRLSLTSVVADEIAFTGVTVFGAHLRVPLQAIAAVDLCRDNFVYLSDLKTSKYDFQPFLDAAWPFAVDGNVAGHDLLLAGSTYDKGISMHSRSRLTYRLAGRFRRLEALAGLDDKDGRGGAVRLRVLADGKTLWDRAVTSQDGAAPVSLSIEGVRELTLEVDFGDDGDVRDVVNWADARLIK
jgi:hypothetical protein